MPLHCEVIAQSLHVPLTAHSCVSVSFPTHEQHPDKAHVRVLVDVPHCPQVPEHADHSDQSNQTGVIVAPVQDAQVGGAASGAGVGCGPHTIFISVVSTIAVRLLQQAALG